MLKVMSLNIWNLSGPWRQRRDEIVAWLRLEAPDVVCLQEVLEAGDGRNQARWLADAAGYTGVAYQGREVGGDVRFGNAVLSRWAIDACKSAPLAFEEASQDVPRCVVWAHTGGLDVFSTHLNWRFDDGWVRERQVVEVVDFVAACAGPTSPLPPIVAGDFNADPDSIEIAFLGGRASLGGRSAFFQDAWRVAGGRGPGLTWDNRNSFAAADREPDRRIDYVFVGWRRDNGAGRILSARVVCDRALTGTFASDHFGVLAEVETA